MVQQRTSLLPWSSKINSKPSSTTRFQVMSDLHLEVGQQYSQFQIPLRAPYLILAGDIGRLCDYDAFRGFLATQCYQFIRVFLVLGNHEFYGTSHPEGLLLAEKLEKESSMEGKLFILNRRRIDLNGGEGNVTILGCTLQSRITDSSKEIVQSRIKDFKHIESWTVEQHNLEHTADVVWLRQQIQELMQEFKQEDALGKTGSHRVTLVITHHAPIRKGSSAPQHEANAWTDAFATELIGTEDEKGDELLSKADWWVFGHTHYTTSCKRHGVNLISNQRGYVFPKLPGVDTDAKGNVGGTGQRTSSRRRWKSLISTRSSGQKKGATHDFDVTKIIET